VLNLVICSGPLRPNLQVRGADHHARDLRVRGEGEGRYRPQGFVKSSPTNQAIAFENVDWFIDRMDDGIDSLKVTRTHTRIHTRIHTLTLSYTPSSSY
jgi:hypothetical protein